MNMSELDYYTELTLQKLWLEYVRECIDNSGATFYTVQEDGSTGCTWGLEWSECQKMGGTGVERQRNVMFLKKNINVLLGEPKTACK